MVAGGQIEVARPAETENLHPLLTGYLCTQNF
jgi:hypothetical protein